MGNLVFTERAWEEYLNWQVEEKRRLNGLTCCSKTSCETDSRALEKRNLSGEIFPECGAGGSMTKTAWSSGLPENRLKLSSSAGIMTIKTRTAPVLTAFRGFVPALCFLGRNVKKSVKFIWGAFCGDG